MHALHPCLLQDPFVWDLVLPFDLELRFSDSVSGNHLVSLHDAGILSRSHKHIRGSAYNSLGCQAVYHDLSVCS